MGLGWKADFCFLACIVFNFSFLALGAKFLSEVFRESFFINKKVISKNIVFETDSVLIPVLLCLFYLFLICVHCVFGRLMRDGG